MNTRISTAFLAAAACFAASCAPSRNAVDDSPATVYLARLQPLNGGTTGMQADGTARFTVRGDSLTISIDVRNVPPDMTHLQHFHGFTDGGDATCATQDADANDDGVVDLIETEPMSGTTMVPFTDDPVSMEIVTDAYPKADASGSYQYTRTVALSALETAFAGAFDGQELALDHRVVYIHGVPGESTLPSTAASLGTIPAQVTLPIACGKIEAVED